jgi:hypothetical protein
VTPKTADPLGIISVLLTTNHVQMQSQFWLLVWKTG